GLRLERSWPQNHRLDCLSAIDDRPASEDRHHPENYPRCEEDLKSKMPAKLTTEAEQNEWAFQPPLGRPHALPVRVPQGRTVGSPKSRVDVADAIRPRL